MTSAPRAHDPLQPLLHAASVLLHAPVQLWSEASGQFGSASVHGLYYADHRMLSAGEITVGGAAGEFTGSAPDPLRPASGAVATSVLRHLDDATADPKVRLIRERSVSPHGYGEILRLESALPEPVTTTVELSLNADFSPLHLVKAGLVESSAPEVEQPAEDVLLWTAGPRAVRITASGARIIHDDEPHRAVARWKVTIPSRGSIELSWGVELSDDEAAVVPADGEPEWASERPRSRDPRLDSWLGAALADLSALRLSTRQLPGETFLAAGAPWFLTLFGRDSIWAARMLLPLGTELAASTLRVLAAFQGTREVAESAEQPGKIMHELRSGILTIPNEGVTLPPLYYGTVDATALWLCLLHDAWRAGMPDDEVEALLPQAEAALRWLRDYGDSDGDGFLEYVDSTGHGLANQGWKDSGDSIQWKDGSLAEGPIALCEVQAYAYEAAIGGAALLEAFGRDGSPWRNYAALLKERFAEAFWIEDDKGAYPAVALDARKRPVDTVTSNIGHLLGTGILYEGQAAMIATRLLSPELSSGFGLRTMATGSDGYWPLSYHGGSVWAHDTAIAILGLAREGFREEAAKLAQELLAAAEGFGYRMPELHSGDSATVVSRPQPYPAACRPQAWSAAAAVSVREALKD